MIIQTWLLLFPISVSERAIFYTSIKKSLCSLGHIHQRLPIKNPTNTWQKERKKFCPGCTEILESRESLWFMCKEREINMYQTPRTSSKGVYPATTLSMVNRYNRYCTMILSRMINITRLEVSGKYAATSLQTMGDYSIRYNRQLAQKKQSNLLLFQILKILYHTEVNWNMLLENHHQIF